MNLSGVPTLLEVWERKLGDGETHPLFLRLAFLAALGAGIGRKVWLERSDIYLPPLFPNPWILLLGPSGRAKKSTAIRLAVKALEEAECAPEIFSGKLTAEALVSFLAASTRQVGPSIHIEGTGRNAEALIISREFDVLISNKQQYTAGLVPLLTDLYDCPDKFIATTVGRGREVLQNVCLSVIGAGVPLTLMAQLPPEAVKGGFLPRFLLGFLPREWKKRVAIPPPVDRKWWEEELLPEVKRVCSMQGEFRMEKKALEKFVDWYENLEWPETEVEEAYMQRIPEHVLRIALLFAVMEGNEGTVTVGHFEAARSFVLSLWKRIRIEIRTFASHPRMRGFYHLLGLLEERGEITKTQVFQELAPFAGSIQDIEKTVSWVLQHPKVSCRGEGKEIRIIWRGP